MYIDNIKAETSCEIGLDNAGCSAYFSVENEIDEYIPNWEITIEPNDGNKADTVAAENTDSSDV